MGGSPTTHPVCAWLAEHAAEVMTKCAVGKVGAYAYERLFGKAVRDGGSGHWQRPLVVVAADREP